MTDKPIIFSSAMVRALIEGRKTQTRRIIKPQPPMGWDRHCWYSQPVYGFTNEESPTGNWHRVKLYAPGDRLWVREGWKVLGRERDSEGPELAFEYLADGAKFAFTGAEEWGGALAVWRKHGRARRPSIFMPRWASRFTLKINEVRVQRLKSISDADAEAEGIFHWRGGWCFEEDGHSYSCAATAFYGLWDSIHHDGKEAPLCVEANPFVAALTFTVERRNIDAPAAAERERA